MSIPRFSNPHLLVGAAEPVSRANLYEDLHDKKILPDPTQVSEYDALVKKTLGDFALEPSRKRRKVIRHSEAPECGEANCNTAFRLLSTTLPPRVLHLKPKPPPEIKVKEPPCEDDEVEARVRKERAAVAAVDFSWIHSESRKPYSSRREKMTTIHAAIPASPTVSLILLEHPRPPIRHSNPLVRPCFIKPSPHENLLEQAWCPRIAFEWAGTEHDPATPKKRKKRHKPSFRKPPR